MNVAICIPCHGNPKFAFTMALAGLVKRSADKIMGTSGIDSSDLPGARNKLAAFARQGGADRVLWLDADMVFPHDALERLLTNDKPLVGANYLRRGYERGPVARTLANEPCWTTAESTGLEVVGGTGLGCFLMDTEVFGRVIQPWFATGSEDYHFFNKARAAGYAVHIDHDLSKEIGHIGENVLKF